MENSQFKNAWVESKHPWEKNREEDCFNPNNDLLWTGTQISIRSPYLLVGRDLTHERYIGKSKAGRTFKGMRQKHRCLLGLVIKMSRWGVRDGITDNQLVVFLMHDAHKKQAEL